MSHPRRTASSGTAPIVRAIERLVRRNEGQDLIEYALLIGIISLAVLVSLSAIGVKASKPFDNLASALSPASNPGAGSPGGGNPGGGNPGGGNPGGGNPGGGNPGGGNPGGGNPGGGNPGGGNSGGGGGN